MLSLNNFVTFKKTITYGKDAVLPPIDPYQNAKKEETLILEDKHECKHKCCHKQLHNDQMSEKTELVGKFMITFFHNFLQQ